MTINELKIQYNKVIELINRGSKYLDDLNVSEADKDKAVPKFRKLVDAAGNILKELDVRSVSYTDNDVLNGFEIGGDER